MSETPSEPLHVLSAEEIADLDRAVAHARVTGKPLAEQSRRAARATAGCARSTDALLARGR